MTGIKKKPLSVLIQRAASLTFTTLKYNVFPFQGFQLPIIQIKVYY